MKNKGYIIGLAFGIPLFIIVVNFLFFQGNNPNELAVKKYINESVLDTLVLTKETISTREQYIVGLSRNVRPSGFIQKYLHFSKKHKKYFSVILFDGFDLNSNYRGSVFDYYEDTVSVNINKNQLQSPLYGTKQNPVPVFAKDNLNLKWKGRGFDSDPFHVTEETNFIFVEQYLKFFMPAEEFELNYNKK